MIFTPIEMSSFLFTKPYLTPKWRVYKQEDSIQ